MSEKRFVRDKVQKYVLDTKRDTVLDLDLLVILLNKFNDENEQLRKQIVEYEMILRQHDFAEKEGFR